MKITVSSTAPFALRDRSSPGMEHPDAGSRRSDLCPPLCSTCCFLSSLPSYYSLCRQVEGRPPSCCRMLFFFLIDSSFLICFHFVYKCFLIYSRPRLKNVDRSTAQQLAVTVGNVTVIITDFKEKTRSSSTSSSTVTSSAGSEQQNQSSSGSESTDKGSSRSSTPKGDMSAVNDES